MTRRARLEALAQWLALGAIVGVACGVLSGVFLLALDRVTAERGAHLWLVFLLPLAGLAVGRVYDRFGAPIRGGTSLVIDTIHDDGPEIPLRMAPMVLVGTLLTHLFGGSAGREGTAVQMGASVADAIAGRLGVSRRVRRQLVSAGVAGGFGSVFGTPIAGAVFGLEFVVLGRVEYDALVPALVASVVGDLVTRGLGVVHTRYPAAPELALSPLVLAKWLVFAGAVALASAAFIELSHAVKKLGDRLRLGTPLRMAAGGAAVVALWLASGEGDYLGLGVPTIVRAFDDPHLPVAAFAWKLVLTAITVGAGFLGGEVTPLFFVGATLGNVLARALGLPLALGAGVGLAAVFAAASNTPLALSIMAIELLGASVAPHVVVVAVVAYVLTGHRSIDPGQRLLTSKSGATRRAHPVPLRDVSADERRGDAPTPR